jgi:hypothetical protein
MIVWEGFFFLFGVHISYRKGLHFDSSKCTYNVLQLNSPHCSPLPHFSSTLLKNSFNSFVPQFSHICIKCFDHVNLLQLLLPRSHLLLVPTPKQNLFLYFTHPFLGLDSVHKREHEISVFLSLDYFT